MSTNAETVHRTGPPPKRRIRNFLLDPRFQLKYTTMVVAVTVAVASVLGFLVYRHSTELTEAVTSNVLAYEMDVQAQERVIAESKAADRDVLIAIVAGIFLMAAALGFTGIVVTHKVVGPAHKMKRLLRRVAAGHLSVEGRLRKGDELQEVFNAFEEMLAALRSRQAEEVEQLDEAIEKARAAGADEAIAGIVAVRDRMSAQLD